MGVEKFRLSVHTLRSEIQQDVQPLGTCHGANVRERREGIATAEAGVQDSMIGCEKNGAVVAGPKGRREDDSIEPERRDAGEFLRPTAQLGYEERVEVVE
ncbi:hypothetical protein [Roseococcus sp. YIM B11640]|uniref:hypothetical protein n=1 Tax=Roseococcus sp. YIM B11640 TaxID=3133973 RepID=UPI003C7AAB36